MFRDSYSFSFFLDSLVKSFAKTGQQNFILLNNTMQNFYPDLALKIVKLIDQKEVFSYDYIYKFDWLDESALLPREQFYNWLANENRFEADYARALLV